MLAGREDAGMEKQAGRDGQAERKGASHAEKLSEEFVNARSPAGPAGG